MKQTEVSEIIEGVTYISSSLGTDISSTIILTGVFIAFMIVAYLCGIEQHKGLFFVTTILVVMFIFCFGKFIARVEVEMAVDETVVSIREFNERYEVLGVNENGNCIVLERDN